MEIGEMPFNMIKAHHSIIYGAFKDHIYNENIKLEDAIIHYYVLRHLEMYREMIRLINNEYDIIFKSLYRILIDNYYMLLMTKDVMSEYYSDIFISWGYVQKKKMVDKLSGILPKLRKEKQEIENNYKKAIIKYPKLKNDNRWLSSLISDKQVKDKIITVDAHRWKYYANKLGVKYGIMPKEFLDAVIHGNPFDFMMKYDINENGRYYYSGERNYDYDFRISMLMLAAIVFTKGFIDSFTNIKFYGSDDVQIALLQFVESYDESKIL